MQLNEPKNLSTSVKINMTPIHDRNNQKKKSVYNILFPIPDDASNQNIEDKNFNKDYGKATFGSVSTLDWLKTWRSLETS